MLLNDFKRLIAPLQKKIFLLLGRAILTLVDNSAAAQLVQLTLLSGETISGVERFQEYGFETYPFTDAEPFAVFLNGNRNRGVVLCIMDSQYRPDDLSEGEVAMYTDEDKSAGGHRIWFKRGQIIQIDCKDVTFNCTGKVTVNATTGCDIDGGIGSPGGVITDQSLDPFTGSPHIDASTTVKASK